MTRIERIERDKVKIEQLQNRIKQNEAKEKEKERKAKFKHTLTVGRVLEEVFGEMYSDERIEQLKKALIAKRKGILKYMKYGTKR